MIFMHVLIQIHYITEIGNQIYQKGNFPLNGKSKEQVALEFWKWIKKENMYSVEIEQVICDGEDITEAVRNLIKAPLK